MQAELGPIRERRKMWEQRTADVFDILKAGTEVAREKAAATLHDVRSSMRITYFEDQDFLNQYQLDISNHSGVSYSGLIFFENYVTIAFIWETDVQLLFSGRSR